MRIAMFSDSYYPYISGVTRAVSTLRSTLQGMGHDISVFCPSYPKAEAEDGVFRFLSVRAPTNSTYYVAVPPFFGLRQRLERTAPEVVHIHSPFNLCKAGYALARRLGIPVVMTYHTMYNMYSHYVPVAGNRVSRLVEGMAFRMAGSVDAVVTPSKVLADYLKGNGVSSPLHPIPNGIPVESFRNGDRGFVRKKYGIPGGIPVLITCGRLGVEKNQGVLLQAFARILREKDAALLLVGDGPLRGQLMSQARSLGISERTFFAGSVAPDLMPHMYAGADLFVFASLTDTQGLVLVEAKAAGLPAVAVGALGVKDMVIDGEDGFLCDNNHEELAAKTLRLLEDPTLLSYMKANAWRNADAFSRESVAYRMMSCYESVLKS